MEAEAVALLNSLPPLHPLCIDQVRDLGDADDFGVMIVATTRLVDGLRRPAALVYLARESVHPQATSDRGVVAVGNSSGWCPMSLGAAEASAVVNLGWTLSVEDAVAMSEMSLNDAWERLAMMSHRRRFNHAESLLSLRPAPFDAAGTGTGARISVATPVAAR